MKSIFTYPNNSGDHFIDPNYVGDDTEGLQKRVKDMKDGNYKTLTNSGSIGTVDQLMEGLSKYNNNPALEEDSGNNTIYKLWEQPILEGSLELQSTSFSISGVGSTTKTEYTANFDSSGNHGFYQDTKVRLTLDGTAGSTNNRSGIAANLGDTEFYVKKIDADTIQLATDSDLNNLIKFYGRESATISSVSEAFPAVFTDSGGHDLTVGTEVTISGANGDIGTAYNGQTFYVNSVSGNDFTLSFDSSLNNDLGYQSQQAINGEKFDFNTSDNNIIVGVDDATRYSDTAQFRPQQAKLEDLDNLETLSVGVTSTTGSASSASTNINHISVNKNGTKVAEVFTGSAVVYSHSGGTLSSSQTLSFGGYTGVDSSSAFDDNGDTFIAGTPGRGSLDTTYGGAQIVVHQLSSGTYSVLQTITFSNSNSSDVLNFESFGTFTDISDDGLKLVTSDRYAAEGDGRTYLYTRANKTSNFTLHTTFTDSTCTGGRVVISGDGDTIVMQHLASGGTTTGVTKVFRDIGGSYTNVDTLVNSADTSTLFDQIEINTAGDKILVRQGATGVHYFKKTSSSNTSGYTLTNSFADMTNLQSTVNELRQLFISSDSAVFTLGDAVFDIVSDVIKFRHRTNDAITGSTIDHRCKQIVFGGTGSDQEMFTFTHPNSGNNSGFQKIYHLDPNNERYMMMAWLNQYNTNGTRTNDTQYIYIKFVSNSGGRDFYKLYTDGQLQNELTFTGDSHLAGKFSSTKDLTFNFPIFVGLPGIATTTGSVLETLPTQGSNIIPVLNIASNNTGSSKITASDNESRRYRLASIQLTHGGQGVTFLQQTGASTFVNNAELKQEFFKAGGTAIDTSNFGPWPSGLTVGTNGSGYITGFTGFNSELPGKFFYSDDIMFTPQTVADTYSAPAASLASQEDVFDMDTEWDTLGYNADKQWPDNVLPQSATVTYNQPNQTTVSQNGTKYVRNFGVNRWQVELVYPPMTASDFGVFHSRVQKAKGQFTPFFLNIKKNNTPWLFKFNDLTYSNVRVKTGLATGGTQVLLEGFATDDVLKEGSLAIAGTMSNGNIHTITNQPTANKYGEVKVRLAYPTQSTLSVGDLFYMKPSHVVVTLSEDGFEYAVDTAGNYFVTVKFDLDEWKA